LPSPAVTKARASAAVRLALLDDARLVANIGVRAQGRSRSARTEEAQRDEKVSKADERAAEAGRHERVL
jgi:hypothetical protein